MRHWTPNPEGNPLIKFAPKPGAVTEIGKLRRDINHFSREWIEKRSPELLELYDWVKSFDDKKQLDYLLELKNFYYVLQTATFPQLLDKIKRQEPLSKKDLDALNLIERTLVDSHKLKYGDKKVIENVVTVADIRRQMMSDKKIIDAEVLSETATQTGNE